MKSTLKKDLITATIRVALLLVGIVLFSPAAYVWTLAFVKGGMPIYAFVIGLCCVAVAMMTPMYTLKTAVRQVG